MYNEMHGRDLFDVLGVTLFMSPPPRLKDGNFLHPHSVWVKLQTLLLNTCSAVMCIHGNHAKHAM